MERKQLSIPSLRRRQCVTASIIIMGAAILILQLLFMKRSNVTGGKQTTYNFGGNNLLDTVRSFIYNPEIQDTGRQELICLLDHQPFLFNETYVASMPLRDKYALLYRSKSCDGCFIRNYTYLNRPNICGLNDIDRGTPALELLVAVFSDPNHSVERNILRETWLKGSNHNPSLHSRHVFLLGEPADQQVQEMINKEAQKYNDIVQMNFGDSNQNLTFKMLMMLQWAAVDCYNARYILKVDEDVYVNITNVLHISRQYVQEDAVLGDVSPLPYNHPIRNPKSPLYVTYIEYPQPKYPPFPGGHSYLLPVNIIPDLLRVSVDTPFLRLDDVYLGLVLEKTPYQVLNVSGFAQRRHISYCHELNHVTTIYPVSPRQMATIWWECFPGFRDSLLSSVLNDLQD